MEHKDKFDEKLFNYFKDNNETPMKITEGIKECNLGKGKKKNFDFYNLRKVAVAAISLVTVSTGVVFAKDISNFIKNVFNDNEGVNTAVESGYVYEIPNVYAD